MISWAVRSGRNSRKNFNISFALFISCRCVFPSVFVRVVFVRVENSAPGPPEFLEHAVTPEDTLTGICMRYKVRLKTAPCYVYSYGKTK